MSILDKVVADAGIAFKESQDNVVKVQATIERVKGQIDTLSGIDPWPSTFLGVIDNYRFTTGPKGAMPTHRFEVLCGNGIYLHVEATPDAFASMMLDMDMGDIKPGKVNDKLCIVQRNPNLGMVPVRMLAASQFPGVFDKWGNFLYIGADVMFRGERGIIVEGPGEGDARVLVDFEGRLETRACNEVVLDL